MVDCSRTWTLAAMGIAAALVAGLGLVPVEQAAADGCGAACRNAYNQCRIATKGRILVREPVHELHAGLPRRK